MIDVKELGLKQGTKEKKICYHCGEPCSAADIRIGDKYFCCQGCKLVFELLEANDMCDYYALEQTPGTSQKEAVLGNKFQYLEDADVRRKMVDFSDGKTSTATFYIPSMHCSSCVWVLESLYKLNSAILSSTVDFIKKECRVTFRESPKALRQVVETLTSIGYEPQINLSSLQEKINKASNKELWLKIGVAGFCFGNIMLLSFPHYLSSGKEMEPLFKNFFRYLSILLALPVLFYSSQDYFKSAWTAWKQRMVNMDVPISLGIAALFGRSLYEILSGGGAGYMDSFAGLVFLLLIGKLFEKKTYDALSFERDYQSYFPVSVTLKEGAGERVIPLDKLEVGNRILIRNQELIPADAILINGRAYIDYSFVTGESVPVEKVSGDMIYAGGRQVGGAIEVDVVKQVNQSYLTGLWNDDAFNKTYKSRITTLADRASRYFTVVVLSVAAGAFFYWLPTSPALALNALTAVLIVACPCALALSTPFTLGNTVRIFGKNKFYLKNTAVIESLARISAVVFDKTGTLTAARGQKVGFRFADHTNGKLNKDELQQVRSLVRQSTHPLSRHILNQLPLLDALEVTAFRELPGLGMEGVVAGRTLRMGSSLFITSRAQDQGADTDAAPQTTRVHLEIDGVYRGFFYFENVYRSGLKETLQALKARFEIFMLSGDNPGEKNNLLQFFEDERQLRFNQTPFDKLEFVKELQNKGKHVLMIGDGLNDAGALKQSDAGISISEDAAAFTPASDGILDAQQFSRLNDFLRFSRISMRIIAVSFAISFFYNLLGLSFAVSGRLSPLIAAVLMPVSSVSVVLFTTGMTRLTAKKMKL